jgi:hypothetical protein
MMTKTAMHVKRGLGACPALCGVTRAQAVGGRKLGHMSRTGSYFKRVLPELQVGSAGPSERVPDVDFRTSRSACSPRLER